MLYSLREVIGRQTDAVVRTVSQLDADSLRSGGVLDGVRHVLQKSVLLSQSGVCVLVLPEHWSLLPLAHYKNIRPVCKCHN